MGECERGRDYFTAKLFWPFLLVIQSGYYNSTVSSTPSNAILVTEILSRPDNHNGYGTDLGGGDTVELLLYLQQRFGPVSSFSGSYRADRWDLTINRTASMYINDYASNEHGGGYIELCCILYY